MIRYVIAFYEFSTLKEGVAGGGRGVPKTPQPGFAGAVALARGNRLSGSPLRGI